MPHKGLSFRQKLDDFFYYSPDRITTEFSQTNDTHEIKL